MSIFLASLLPASLVDFCWRRGFGSWHCFFLICFSPLMRWRKLCPQDFRNIIDASFLFSDRVSYSPVRFFIQSMFPTIAFGSPRIFLPIWSEILCVMRTGGSSVRGFLYIGRVSRFLFFSPVIVSYPPPKFFFKNCWSCSGNHDVPILAPWPGIDCDRRLLGCRLFFLLFSSLDSVSLWTHIYHDARLRVYLVLARLP